MFSASVLPALFCVICLCDVTASMFIPRPHRFSSNDVDPLCAGVSCRQMLINCVDAVHLDRNCCPDTKICVNGANCLHNGKKINGLERHVEVDYNTGCRTVCFCPPAWRVRYNDQTEAECRQHCPSRKQRG